MRPIGAFRCNSIAMKWFLTTFARWKVYSAHYRPISKCLGLVLYQRSWVLVPIE